MNIEHQIIIHRMISSAGDLRAIANRLEFNPEMIHIHDNEDLAAYHSIIITIRAALKNLSTLANNYAAKHAAE